MALLFVTIAFVAAACGTEEPPEVRNATRAAWGSVESVKVALGGSLEQRRSLEATLGEMRRLFGDGYPRNSQLILGSSITSDAVVLRMALFGAGTGGPLEEDEAYVELCMEFRGRMAGTARVDTTQIRCPATLPEGAPPADLVAKVLAPEE